jgi:hypothetical protein
MSGFRFAFAGAQLVLAITLIANVAEAAPPKKCDDIGREQAQQNADCVSPTFPSRDHGICSKGACYRSAVHNHHKRTKK